MPGQFYANPDCLEVAEVPITRTIDEMKAAARHCQDSGILVITEREFEQIKSQVGLGYRWQGRRIFVR